MARVHGGVGRGMQRVAWLVVQKVAWKDMQRGVGRINQCDIFFFYFQI